MAVKMAAIVSKLAVLTPHIILEFKCVSIARFIDVIG